MKKNEPQDGHQINDFIVNEKSIMDSVVNRGTNAELIYVTHEEKDHAGDESVTLHFTNGGEIFIYINSDGKIVVEGD